MNRLIYAVTLLTLCVMSCGMQVQPAAKLADHIVTDNKMVNATPTASPRHALVCMAGVLNFRNGAGTDQPVIASYPDGYVIDVLAGEKVTEDGAVWRETSEGWANSRFLCMEAE